MHPFHAEIHARTEIDARRRDAEQRRLVALATEHRPHRAGTLLVAMGERFTAAGRRLQGRAVPTPCLEGC